MIRQDVGATLRLIYVPVQCILRRCQPDLGPCTKTSRTSVLRDQSWRTYSDYQGDTHVPSVVDTVADVERLIRKPWQHVRNGTSGGVPVGFSSAA